MFDPFTLAMIGAGAGALLDPKKPLRGAAIGGSLGYGGGTLLGAGGAGAGAGAATGASTGAASTIVPGSIESAGMVFNPATGTYLDPSSFTSILGMPTYTGGQGLLSNAMGNIGDNLSGLGKYATPQNLMGVGSLLSNMDTMPRVQSSGGGIRGGGAVKFEPFVTGQVYTRKKRG